METNQLGLDQKAKLRELKFYVKQFTEAYNTLNALICNVDYGIEINDLIADGYPFDESFDELQINDWRRLIELKINNLL